MKALELRGVSRYYRRGDETVHALRGVDLSVRAGEFVAVVGPSGSGKSTLLHVAAGLAPADEGVVMVRGQDIASLSRRECAVLRRRHIGFVFQAFHLLPSLTLLENVAMPLLLNGHPAGAADAAARQSLDAVGLAGRAGHVPGQVSGGELQRAAIARALVHGPTLVVADEPTGSLDRSSGQTVLEMLADGVSARGATLLLATHDVVAAERADRVVTLLDGAIS